MIMKNGKLKINSHYFQLFEIKMIEKVCKNVSNEYRT